MKIPTINNVFQLAFRLFRIITRHRELCHKNKVYYTHITTIIKDYQV
jgi:hypothetical protein